jgi:hypothetical protein
VAARARQIIQRKNRGFGKGRHMGLV